MRRRELPLLLASALCCGLDVPPPLRLALVIGNGAYDFSDPLPNAPKDAAKIADKLRSLDFKVQANTLDLDRGGLAKAIDDFGRDLKAAGPNVVGFVYYAGHAAQDAFGVNYLVPIDAKARTPDELRKEGTAVQPLLQVMEDANNNVNIIVLDACRDWYKKDRTPGDPRGLHDMGLHASILIAFATRADSTADEGANLDSSPFSHRLLEALDQQAADPVALVFDDIQSRVYADTDAMQFPIFVDGLIRAGRWSLRSNALANVKEKPTPPVVRVATSPFLQQLDRSRLLQFARNKESFVDTFLKRRDILERREINTPIRIAYFLAALAFETGGFQFQLEKFGFTAQRLRTVYPTRFPTDEIAQRYAGKPEMVANLVYANRLGNGPEASGDGWRYRGRGLFFITGRDNYRRYGEQIGVDLVSSPDLVNDLETGFAIACAYWTLTNANAGADADDLPQVTRRTGGLAAQIPERAIWLAQAKRAVAPAP